MIRLVTFLLLAALAGGAARAADPDLKLVIILGRHGVRSPILTNAELDAYSAQPWPGWPVKVGLLTPRGAHLMSLLGRYYGQRYQDAGLLTGGADDAAWVTIRADVDKRTVESAELLGEGLLGGRRPRVLARTSGFDPLFSPVKMSLGNPDSAEAVAQVLRRLGGDPASVVRDHRKEFELLHHVLFGDAPVPPGKIDVLRLPITVVPGRRVVANLVDISGAPRFGLSLVDVFLLEYVEGMPPSQIGWGRLDKSGLTELLTLHSLYFDLCQATRYPAQAQASNLARHMEETVDQAIAGAPVPGAVGPPGQRIVVLLGHDTNLINLGSLLGISWTLPDTGRNPVLPGSALVLELRHHPGGPWNVRMLHISQTLDQLRYEEPLGRDHPPAVIPIVIPGCSGGGPGYDAPWSLVKARLDRVIDPRFVVPGSS